MGNCLKCRNSGSSEDVTQGREGRRAHHESRRARYPGFLDNDPILHPAPGVSRPMSQLTEEEQVKIATRMGLISTLPLFTFDEGKREKLSECIICMCEYEEGEELRYLPCLHTYHRVCIDDWLMRALTCPSCLEEIRPSSPPVQRTAIQVSAPSMPDVVPASNEPSSYYSAHSDSTIPVPSEVVDNGASNAPDVMRDSQYVGDSMLATSPDQSTELTDRDLNEPIRPPLAQTHTAKLVSRNTDENNGNESGGDGVHGPMVVSSTTVTTVPPITYLQHRRARSNEHGVVRSSSLNPQSRSAHRSNRHQRRGNSVSGLDRLPGLSTTAAIAPGSDVRILVNEPVLANEILVTSSVTNSVARSSPGSGSVQLWPCQLNGDSEQP